MSAIININKVNKVNVNNKRSLVLFGVKNVEM